jgi:hypothetical protein
MEKQRTTAHEASRVRGENVETGVRDHVQGVIRQVLEPEVSAFLGRQKTQRRSPLDERGSRNGDGKPRCLPLSWGTIRGQRPRVRATEARFIRQVVPLCKRKSTTIETVVPERYRHGVARGGGL